ncbi:MAG: beta-methylgalactoside transporter [Clostridia bacterium]|nr:beta-methylgalactoside transporter [Clostridia bacterium]
MQTQSKETAARQVSAGQKILKFITGNPIVFLLLIAAIVVGVLKDNFFSWANLANLISNTAVRFLIALGVSGCLITKGTDLSAGRQVGFAAVVAGILCQRGDYTGRLWKWAPEMDISIVLVIVVVLGLAWGLINGVIVTKLHVPPFIATLGTQTIIYGISLVISDAQPIGGFQKIYTTLINGRIGNVRSFHLPYLLFVALLFGLLFYFIYNYTRHGKYMYAIGGNDIAAEVSGVNTTATLMRIYAAAGVMYAIAGYLLAAKSGGASASMGQGYELEAIAGCTIGGVSTTGGIGTVPGILVGVLVFELLKIILQFLGVNPYYNYVVQGLVIVLAVSLDIRKYIAKK